MKPLSCSPVIFAVVFVVNVVCGWISKVHGGGQWNIGQRHGKLMRGLVPDDQVAMHFGPLLRFSARLLALLQDESAAGSTAHAEIAPSTLCNVTQWCTMGNLSIAVMGGRDGGLFDYKLPVDISSPIYAALEELAPGKVRQGGVLAFGFEPIFWLAVDDSSVCFSFFFFANGDVGRLAFFSPNGGQYVWASSRCITCNS